MGEIGSIGKGRLTTVSATSINTGNEVQYSSDQIPWDEWPRAIVSSASIPAVFPHQLFMNDVLMDGGMCHWGVKPEVVVQQCLKIVDSLDQITLDIIMLEKPTVSEAESIAGQNTHENYARAKDIKSYNSGMSNVFEAVRAYPDVNWRYLFQPSEHVPNGPRLMNFNNESTWFMQEMGRRDAQNLLTKEPGYAFALLQDWHENQEPSFSEYLWSFIY